ncbi:MAG: hypothetical protein EPN73_22585 [Paraburkholderia sp.]|nr:MAG: hypothetical protein EPN73_22585 [Paraburkholderia sp.]
MSVSGRSLRALVERWVGAADGVRVTHFSHGRDEPFPFVRVEGVSNREIALIFFRHADGSWCVFPPEGRRPAMQLRI